MNYVCGFAVSPNLQYIALIEKKHPEWQKGKWNGIGGRIQISPEGFEYERESPKAAMSREFLEETGLEIPPEKWHCFQIEQFKTGPDEKEDTKVYYFITICDKLVEMQSMTDEVIGMFTQEIFQEMMEKNMTIFNIQYLYMMVLHHLKNKTLMELNPEGINS